MAKISLQAAYDQAQQLLEENQPEKSIAVAQHILESVPDNLEAHRILGEAYLFDRQFEKAERAFAHVLRADPENIPAHVGIGITYERQGKLDRAINEFEQALEIKPDMTELRSQLLRLYVDAWGSEHAQLRLSRAGLARLYARGYMLPQAIQEFRSVVAEQPERFDAYVGLIEALWRNGEEDKMVEMAQHILSERPDLLKANLLLGYIKLMSGQPDGAQYWRVAQRLDPYQNVATLLFGKLPDNAPDVSTMIPEWDEQEWRRKQEQQEAVVATSQPAPAFAEAAPQTPQARQPTPGQSDDDLLASLLGLQAFDMASDLSEASAESEPPVAPFSFDDFDNLETTTPAAAQEKAEPVEPSVAPFSFDDLDTMGQDQAGKTGNGLEQVQPPHAPPPQQLPRQEQEESADQPDITPLSLAELGLSEEEIALMQGGEDAGLSGIDMVEGQEAQKEQDTSGELSGLPDIEPFDWMSEPGEPAEILPPPAPPTPQKPEPEPDMEQDPFAGMEGMEGDPFAGGMQPFDLDDLGEGGLEEKMGAETEMPAELQPFDWSSDYGEEDLPSAGAPAGGEPSDSDLDQNTIGSLQPFSLDDLDLTGGEGFPEGVDPAQVSLPPSLQPFSLEEGESLPHPPPVQEAPAMPEPIPRHSDEQDEGEVSNPAAYSWQLPSSKPDTDFLRKSGGETSEPPPSEEAETSIFAKLKQRRQELAPTEETPLPSVSDAEVAEDENVRFFSDDDISLRGGSGIDERMRLEQQEPSRPFSETEETGGDEEGITPFSLEGLEGIGEGDVQVEESAVLSDWPEPSEPAASPVPPVPTESQESGEPEIAPLSLAELGLSEEEIAALNEQEGKPEAAAPEVAVSEPSEPAASPVPTESQESGEPEIAPLSLAELGLSEEEIAALNEQEGKPEAVAPEVAISEPSEPAASPVPTESLESGEPEVAPLSLAELGLSEEEIAALNEQEGEPEAAAPEAIMPETAEGEMAEGEMVDWSDWPEPSEPAAAPVPTESQESGEPEIAPLSLEELGLSEEEIAALNEQEGKPETAAPEVAVSEPSEPAASPVPTESQESGEPEIAPLSLAELGLSEEEIAALNEQEGKPETAAPEAIMPETAEGEMAEGEMADWSDWPEPSEPAASPVPTESQESGEPEIAPLSLAELGLSEEEIAALNEQEGKPEAAAPEVAVSEPSEPAASPVPTESQESGEPEIAPLSLAELGLSEEEIAALNEQDQEGEPEAAAPEAIMPETAEGEMVDWSDWPEPSEGVAAPVPTESQESGEPEVSPLSLEELGLSEEEIAALNEQEGEPAEEPAMTVDQEDETEAGRTQVLPDEGTGATPFSLEDLVSEQPAPAEPEVSSPKGKAPETQLLDDVDILPFSLDDLGLDEGPSFGEEQEKLGLTDDELSGWETLGSVEESGSKPLGGTPDTGDPALNHLISLGQNQGFVDLTDIINIVDDPVAESERIEDIGRALYRAGIEIRDGDEVIDMEEVEYAEEYEGEGEGGSEGEELDAAAATRVDEEIMPLSLEELGLSEEEITSLGLQEQEQEAEDFATVEFPQEETQHPEPEPEPLPPPPPAADAPSGKDAEIAPLSLAELGLTAEEIAMLGLESGESGEKVSETKSEEPPPASQATSPAPPAEPEVAPPAEPAPPAPQTEPEIAPLSLAELGLSEEEIAMLGLESGKSSEKVSEQETSALPPAPQAEPERGPPAEPVPVPSPPQAEPEIAPLSLAELGLTEEEIAMLGLGTEQSSKVRSSETQGKGEPEGFGLTDEQLTALSGLASTSSGREESAFSGSAPSHRPESELESEPALDDDSLFDFSLTKEEEASLTSAPQGPRKEDLEPEEPHEPTPEDLAFVPASLDEMDDIWDLPDIAPDMGPARITIERPQRPDDQHGDQHLDDAPSHRASDDARTTGIRPKLPGERVPIRDRRTRPGWRGTSSSEQKHQPTAFIPTGDEDLDENLRQFEAEPENYGLCFAIAHIGMETGRYDLAISHYRILVKAGEFLDDVLDDLLEQIQGVEDESIRKQFYRLTGDIYTRQKRFKEATAAYRGKLF